MSSKPLKDGTADQIAGHARTSLGLDVPEGMSAPEVLALIRRAGIDPDALTLAVEAPRRGRPPKAEATPAASGDVEEGSLVDMYVTIILPEVDGEPEMEPVSVDGRAMYIRRGQESRIRYPYYAALREARRFVYSSDERRGLTSRREVQAIPLQIIEMPPEVRAFEAQLTARRRAAA